MDLIELKVEQQPDSISTEPVRKTPAPGTPERREYNNLSKQKSREKQAAEKDAKSAKYTSATVTDKKDAKEFLATRILNEHVVDICYELGVIAAERLGLVANKFFWLHGLQNLLASKQQRKEVFLDIVHDELVPGEVIHKGDVYALWDYSISWRSNTSFLEFLMLRNLCKTDAFQLGLILGKDFHEYPDGPHAGWRDFYPRLSPTLQPGYTQEEMKEWLAAQDPVKDRLLMASRNAYKSSWNIVWLVSAVLCCPDIRLLLVSETNKLSKGFIRGFRNYFEIANKRDPSRFQQLFPEHMIPPGDGSVLSFESPMRHLNLIQFTAEATSMESTVAGQRADIIVFDDPISDRNTGNEEQRQKSVDIFDATQKLREVGGYTVLIGTPWHTEDLYATLIRRTQADEQTESHERMQIRIDPAWKVKEHAKHKTLSQLQEQDVELLFPSRLSWKFLQKELRANEVFFRSQNLCEFVSEDDQIKITFVDEDLRARLRPGNFFERNIKIHTVLSVDPSFSQARYADFSALAVLEIIQYDDPTDVMKSRTICFVREVRLERLRQSELAKVVVSMIMQYQISRVVIEKISGFEDLLSHIYHNAAIQQFALPHIYPKPTVGKFGAPAKAKAGRIKGLEILLAENRLYFQIAPWNDLVFRQFVHFDGVKKSGGSDASKDDAPDAIAIGAEVYMPRFQAETNSGIQQEAEEQARIQEYIRAQQNHIFGSNQPREDWVSRYQYQPDEPEGGIHQQLGRFNLLNKARAA